MVHGPDGTHRLPAIGDSVAGPPADGARWAAAFAWQELPVAFDRARLELGAGLAVELPGPGEAADGRSLPVERPHQGNGAAPPVGEVLRYAADVDGAAGRMRLEAQLLDAQEQLEEARAAARRAEEELARSQADLTAEREGRASDAERFRDGLTKVRSSAEEALGAAAAARTQADGQAQAEIAALREQVGDLEQAGAESAGLRSELEQARAETARVQSELEQVRMEIDTARDEATTARSDLDAARIAVAEARAGAQDVLDRLAPLADPAAEGR